MSLSNESLKPTSATGEDAQPGFVSSEPNGSMHEFYQLSQELLVVTLVLAAIIFICVWIFYSLNIALNYLIGAGTGVVYLKMLGKNVEQLGRQNPRISKTRFAVFIGLIVVATQWQQLQILPIFLGFVTYKAALIVYMVRIIMPPDP